MASRVSAMPYLPILHTAEETESWMTTVVLPHSDVWVVEQDSSGQLAGFVVVEGTNLEHLYIAPSSRRQGIGSMLLEAAQHASTGTLSLNVFQRNTLARAFYERHGFELVELRDGSANEEHEPDATYRWVRLSL